MELSGRRRVQGKVRIGALAVLVVEIVLVCSVLTLVILGFSGVGNSRAVDGYVLVAVACFWAADVARRVLGGLRASPELWTRLGLLVFSIYFAWRFISG